MSRMFRIIVVVLVGGFGVEFVILNIRRVPHFLDFSAALSLAEIKIQNG